MKKKRFFSDLILLIVIIGGSYLLIVLDPSGNLYESVISIVSYLVIGLLIILLIAGCLALLFLMVKHYRGRGADAERSNFLEEMQSMLQVILTPLGFIEHIGPAERILTVKYTKGKVSVKLEADIMDSLYYLSAGSKLENGSFSKDFFLEGHISGANKFKSDSMARLNEWLIRNKLKERLTEDA